MVALLEIGRVAHTKEAYAYTSEPRAGLLGGDEPRPKPGESPTGPAPGKTGISDMMDYDRMGGVILLNAEFPCRHSDGAPVAPIEDRPHLCRGCRYGYSDNAVRAAQGFPPGPCSECHDDAWTIRGMEFAREIGDTSPKVHRERDIEAAHQAGWRQKRVTKIDHDYRARYEEHMQNKAIREWMESQKSESCE